jgi:hypothetical protein
MNSAQFRPVDERLPISIGKSTVAILRHYVCKVNGSPGNRKKRFATGFAADSPADGGAKP